MVYSHITKICSLLNSTRYSVKRHDLSKSTTRNMGDADLKVPGLDCETGWSSAFIVIKNANKARKILSLTANQLYELSEELIS